VALWTLCSLLLALLPGAAFAVDPNALRKEVQAAFDAEDYDGVIRLADEFLKTNRDPVIEQLAAKSHNKKAQKAYAEGKYDAAVLHLEAALALLPNPKLWKNLGKTLLVLNRMGEAVIAFERALAQGGLTKGEVQEIKAEMRATRAKMRELGAQVTVETTPPGATVRFDSEGGRGYSSPITFWLSAGSHRVFVEKSGFLPQDRGVDITAGKDVSLVISLTAGHLPSEGTIRIQGETEGATLSVDGKLVTLAQRVVKVPAGRHVVRATRGVQEREVTVIVGAGKESVATISWPVIDKRAKPRVELTREAPGRALPWMLTIAGVAGVGAGAIFQALGARHANTASGIVIYGAEDRARYDSLKSSYDLDRQATVGGYVAGGLLLVGGVVWLLLTSGNDGDSRSSASN